MVEPHITVQLWAPEGLFIRMNSQMGIEFTYALESFHAFQMLRLAAGHAKILSLKYFGAMAFEYFEYLILVVLLE